MSHRQIKLSFQQPIRSLNFIVVKIAVSFLLLICLFTLSKAEINSACPTESEIFYENRTWEQNDERLLKYILKEHLRPPSTSISYSLKHPTGNPSGDEVLANYILNVLKDQKRGFFVECGALDGETLSNTLVLERDYGWTGLLIEPSTHSYAALLRKKRKAYTANICLSLINGPQLVNFGEVQLGSKILDWQLTGSSAFEKNLIYNKNATIITKKCFPIFSVLSALKVATVDFFSLAIGGAELEVLKTIPFRSILIKIFSIGGRYIPEPTYKAQLKKFMESKDYKFIKETPNFLFVHKTVLTDSIIL